MFEEILLIKTRLDALEAKKMEKDLSDRFMVVTKRFGQGLNKFTKIALGGSIFGGIGLALINKILNPLEEVETKIKQILEQGQEVSDTAEKFGGTPAELYQLQKVGENAGLSPQQITEMLTKFQERQALAVDENAHPLAEKHVSTQVLGNLANNANSIEALLQFLKDLRTKSAPERLASERAIFDTKLTGGQRRLADTDYEAESKRLGLNNLQQVGSKLKHLDEVDALDRAQKAANHARAFLQNAGDISPDVITNINAREAVQQDKLNRQLSNLTDLQKLQVSADKIKDGLDLITEKLGQLVVKGDEAIQAAQKLTQSRTLRVGPTGQTRWE